MKITKVEALPVSIPYLHTVVQAHGSADVGRHVILKLHTDEGIVGLGEATLIRPDRTGETQENITLALRNYLGPMLIGEDPFDIDRIMGKLEEAVIGKYGFLYSKSAIDCALYDIMGKALGVPVYKLLGGATRKKLIVGMSLPKMPVEEIGQAAIELREIGYAMIGVKIGFNPKDDLARVAAVREALGPDFPIEVDANQGYTPPEAIKVIRQMEKYNIQACEQPVAWWDLDGMAEVARAVDTPIIADESVHTTVQAMEVIRKRAADIICLKLPKCGGYYFSKKIVAIAEAGGLQCSIGNRYPFGVGSAALHHFVAATKEIEEPMAWTSPLRLWGDDIIKDPVEIVDGHVSVGEKPGLGVELDEEKVQKYADPIVGG